MKKFKNIYEKNSKKIVEDHHVPMNYNDYEGRMAKQNLYKLHKYSKELFEMIHDYQEMESWIQEKIAKAADYIGSVKHYMEYEMNYPEGEKDQYDDEETYEQVHSIDDILPLLRQSVKENKTITFVTKDSQQVMVNSTLAENILNTYEELNDYNREKFANHLIESKNKFWTIANFSSKSS